MVELLVLEGARRSVADVAAARPGQDASLAHVLARLALVEERIRTVVAARRRADPTPDDPFRGLYLSDATVDRLLDGHADADAAGRGDDRPDALTGRIAAVEAAADAAAAGGATLRLRELAARFDLDGLDLELLLIALAPDVDPRLERLYGYLNDDVSRRRPTIALAFELCGLGLAAADARTRLDPGAPLRTGGLLSLVEADRPFAGRELRVPDRVTAHLLGDDRPDPVLGHLLIPAGDVASPGAASEGTIMALRRGLAAGAELAYLVDRAGADVRGVARAALQTPPAPDRPAGAALLELDLAVLDPAEELIGIARAAAREAGLGGSGLMAGPMGAVAERGLATVRAFVRTLRAVPGRPVILHGGDSWDPRWSSSVPLVLEAPASSAAEGASSWAAALAEAPGGGRAAEAVLELPFRLGPAAIRRAAASAGLMAAASDRPIGVDDLAAGVRAGNSVGLERLARRIHPSAGWDDLVLPAGILEQLRELGDRARLRSAVLRDWGLASPSRGDGLTALFTGDSGTGKTLSAEVVAGSLGLDLYVIDLSTVVDKYIGETEKNLDRVFDGARGVNGVLLFDEADALFGKRSEVRDARDRYANLEIAYLLQRMETFDGVAILTTNLRANLDEAFTRRIDAVVDFPMPDERLRRRLWRLHLGPGLPVDDDLELDFLADRFRLSGGSIRNVVLAAAYRAAARGGRVSTEDLIRATDREYRKLGHLSTESEFGPWHRILTRQKEETDAPPPA